jgi:type IV pilus assembly protein PilW
MRSLRGLTLLELLVATFLGVLLTGIATGAYLSARQHYLREMQIARIQENGRYALRFLTEELSMAGFYGGSLDTRDAVPGALVADCSGESWALDARMPLDLVNNYSALPAPVSAGGSTYACLQGVAVREGSDLLVIKRTASEASLRGGVVSDSARGGSARQWYLRVAAGEAPSWELLSATDLWTRAAIDSGASYWTAVSRIMFIRTYSVSPAVDTIPTLCIKTLAGESLTTRCLVEGVENLQLEVGTDTDGDGAVDRYLMAPGPAALAAASSVRLHLLLRSIDPVPGYRDRKTYRLGAAVQGPAGDGYMRQVISTTVALRNHPLAVLP